MKESKFAYIVFDAGRKTKIFFSRRKAEWHRLDATCGKCHPKRKCPHYYESFTIKVGYTSLSDIKKQYGVGKK